MAIIYFQSLTHYPLPQDDYSDVCVYSIKVHMFSLAAHCKGLFTFTVLCSQHTASTRPVLSSGKLTYKIFRVMYLNWLYYSSVNDQLTMIIALT